SAAFARSADGTQRPVAATRNRDAEPSARAGGGGVEGDGIGTFRLVRRGLVGGRRAAVSRAIHDGGRDVVVATRDAADEGQGERDEPEVRARNRGGHRRRS